MVSANDGSNICRPYEAFDIKPVGPVSILLCESNDERRTCQRSEEGKSPASREGPDQALATPRQAEETQAG